MQDRISTEQAGKLMERYQALKNTRAPWDSFWREIAEYFAPRKAPGIGGTVSVPTTVDGARIFDATGIQSALVLSNGCLAWMSPQETPWFAFDPGELVEDGDARRWLNRCTTVTAGKLKRSKFYTAVHEFYLDRGTFGTGCLYVEEGRKRDINVRCWPIGSYVVEEDDEGDVETVVREFALTARQAVGKFGRDEVSKNVREAYQAGGSKADEPVKFLHFIYPREKEDRREESLLPEDMPIARVYMEEGTKHVNRVSGYPEMPVFVSKYLEWGSNLGNVYGWSPAFTALPEVRQLNFLQKMLDALAEKKAFPSILAHEKLEGQIDPNAAGVTYFSDDIQGKAGGEWLVSGDYNTGKDRVIERQNAVKAAFHVDLFQMLSQVDKQMTAREVEERASEKLIQFSPTFARLTTELFNPLLERLFGIGLRMGWYGEPPESLVVPVSETQGYVAPPDVNYSSRIALSMRSLPVQGIYRTIEIITAMQPLFPDVVDNFDADRAVAEVMLNQSMPEGVQRAEGDVDQIREQRAAAQQQAMQAEQMAMAADAAAKVGRVPAESPVGQAVQQQLQAAA